MTITLSDDQKQWALGTLIIIVLVLAVLLMLYLSNNLPWLDNKAVIHSITFGAATCPSSTIAGWTMGRGWSQVSNVTNCSQPKTRAAWVLIIWPDGNRTSLCIDSDKTVCR